MEGGQTERLVSNQSPHEGPDVSGRDIEYREPRSLAEAAELAAAYGDEGKLLAGGTALVLFMRQRLLAPGCLINIQRVRELGAIALGDGRLTVGATVTHAQAAASPAVRAQYAALAETFARVATPRIRNSGTVGGNLAHGDPHLDPPVTLLALDASVAVRSARSERTIPLTEFFRDYYETALQPDEVLARISIPARTRRSGLAFIKFLPRSLDDYATVDVSVWVRLAEGDHVIEEARVALGSVGSTPFRALEAESVLAGESLGSEVLAEAGARAASAADPEDDVRGSPAYKRELIKVLVPRAVNLAVADARARVEPGGSGADPQER